MVRLSEMLGPTPTCASAAQLIDPRIESPQQTNKTLSFFDAIEVTERRNRYLAALAPQRL